MSSRSERPRNRLTPCRKRQRQIRSLEFQLREAGRRLEAGRRVVFVSDHHEPRSASGQETAQKPVTLESIPSPSTESEHIRRVRLVGSPIREREAGFIVLDEVGQTDETFDTQSETNQHQQAVCDLSPSRTRHRERRQRRC